MAERASPSWAGYLGLVVFTFVATVAAFIIHELGHYLTAQALGFDSWFTLNTSGVGQGEFPTPFETTLITLAGPAITVVQAVIAAALIGQGRRLWLFALVAIAFWQRVTAMAVSLLVYPNDEARISLMWGWEIWMLPALVVGFLGAVMIWAGIRARVGIVANLVIYLGTTLGIMAVVFGDQILNFRVG